MTNCISLSENKGEGETLEVGHALWEDSELFSNAHGQFCTPKGRVVTEGYNDAVLVGCREKEEDKYDTPSYIFLIVSFACWGFGDITYLM